MRNTKKIGWFVLALVLYGLFFSFVMSRDLQEGFVMEQYIEFSSVILQGWWTTIYISLSSIVLALFVGLLLYLMEQTNFPFSKILKNVATIHKNIIFGTPLLVITIVSYYYIGNAFGIQNKIVVGVLTLGLYIGAYVSDIYKGAIDAIHLNQWQTAKMFGFTKYQTYRYVVFPQILVTVLPALAGQLALTIKGSALLALMGTDEFYNTINKIMAVSYRYPEGFLIMAAGYLTITIPLIKLVRYLEVKANYKKDGMSI